MFVTEISHDNRFIIYGPPHRADKQFVRSGPQVTNSLSGVEGDKQFVWSGPQVTNSLSGVEGDKQFVWSGPQVTNSLSGVHQPMRICVSHPIYNKPYFKRRVRCVN